MSNLQLKEVTEMYSSIKDVVDGARKVYLVSMNAMLFSRNMAGENSGFVMVTSQLRDFSARLTAMMGNLREMMSEVVRDVATQAKLERNDRLVNLATRSSGRGSDFVTGKALDRQQQIVERTRRRLNYEGRQLRLMTKMGSNLVLLARVESEGSGNTNATLQSITAEMERVMGRVDESLIKFQKIAA